MSKVSSLLLFLCWYFYAYPSVGDPVGTRCTKEKKAPTCVCKTPKGTIDLTKIANFDGTPTFTGLTDISGYIYNYNPCTPFTTGDACTNVHICQSAPSGNDSFPIAAYGTEQIWNSKNGYYVYYTAPADNGLLREAFVHLLCDPNAKGPEVTAEGDCNSSKGIIDLTKIASYTGTPRFSKIKDHSEPQYNYAYNPCSAFSDPGNICKDVQICQTVEDSDTAFIIGKYGTEEIKIDDNGKISVHYNATTGDGFSLRTAIVHLKCDQSVKTQPTLTTTGDEEIILQYEFALTSCHACPGGCANETMNLLD